MTSSKKKATDRAVWVIYTTFLPCFQFVCDILNPDFSHFIFRRAGHPQQLWKSRALTGAAQAGTLTTAGPTRRKGRVRALRVRTDGETTGQRRTRTRHWPAPPCHCPKGFGWPATTTGTPAVHPKEPVRATCLPACPRETQLAPLPPRWGWRKEKRLKH